MQISDTNTFFDIISFFFSQLKLRLTIVVIDLENLKKVDFDIYNIYLSTFICFKCRPEHMYNSFWKKISFIRFGTQQSVLRSSVRSRESDEFKIAIKRFDSHRKKEICLKS